MKNNRNNQNGDIAGIGLGLFFLIAAYLVCCAFLIAGGLIGFITGTLLYYIFLSFFNLPVYAIFGIYFLVGVVVWSIKIPLLKQKINQPKKSPWRWLL